MAPKTNRFTIALDDDSVQLLKMMEEFTGLTPAQTIAKTFPSHLEEFWFYLTWLQQLPEGPSRLRSLGCSLLQSYGPSSLIQDIQRLDPTYKPKA
jgi:hypothetical protein